jgi:hypothetical protein
MPWLKELILPYWGFALVILVYWQVGLLVSLSPRPLNGQTAECAASEILEVIALSRFYTWLGAFFRRLCLLKMFPVS